MKVIHQVFLLTVCCTVLLTACTKGDIPSPTQAQAVGMATNVSDADVTAHVQVALNNVPDLDGMDIKVVTTKGDVRLTGVVTSQTQVASAISAARAAEGAHTIHNKLTVQQ